MYFIKAPPPRKRALLYPVS